MSLKQKTIICGSCGSALLIATHIAAAMPVHVPGHDLFIAIAQRQAHEASIKDVHTVTINENQIDPDIVLDRGLIIVGAGPSLKKGLPTKKPPVAVLSLSAILVERIEFEMRDVKRIGDTLTPEKSSYFRTHGIQKTSRGRLSGKLGKKHHFPIRQPLNRSSAYKYRKNRHII